MTTPFPTDIAYDYANTMEPHLLTPGYFISRASAMDLFEESTSEDGNSYPRAITDEGNDLFIISAGSTLLNTTSTKVTWTVELMSEQGSLISLEGYQPNGFLGGIQVAQSFTPMAPDSKWR